MVPYCLPGLPVIGSSKVGLLVIGAYSIVQFVGWAHPEYGFGRTVVQMFVVPAHSFERPAMDQAITRATARAALSLGGVALADAAGTPQFFIVPLLLDVAKMLHHPQRRTVADLLAGTVVVSMPPYRPHRAPAMPMYSADDTELGSPPQKMRVDRLAVRPQSRAVMVGRM